MLTPIIANLKLQIALQQQLLNKEDRIPRYTSLVRANCCNYISNTACFIPRPQNRCCGNYMTDSELINIKTQSYYNNLRLPRCCSGRIK